MDLTVLKLCSVILLICVQKAKLQSASPQIRGTRGPLPGIRTQVQGTMGPIPGVRPQRLGVRAQLPGIRAQFPTGRGQMLSATRPLAPSGTRSLSPGIRGQMPAIRSQIPINIPQMSGGRGRMLPGPRGRDVTIRSRISAPTMPARMPRVPGVTRIRSPMIGTSRPRIPINFRQTGPVSRSGPRPMNIGSSGPRDLRSFVSLTRGPSSGPLTQAPRFRGRPRILPRSGPPSRVTLRQQQQQPRLRPVSRIICRRPTVATCRRIPRGQRARTRTSLCYMPCPGRRACIVPCECACLPETRRMDPRSRSMPRGGASGPISVRNMLQFQRPQSRSRFQRPINSSRPSDLTFGISESALAAILSNPDVSSLVGPQGINDILAGETPPIISGGADAGVGPAGQINPAPRETLVPRTRPAAGSAPPAGMGIPVPMPPVTRPPDPQMGNQMGNDMLLAGLLASSGDLGEMAREMTGLQMRTNIPAARGAQIPAMDLMLPSATIDNTVRVPAPSRGANGSSAIPTSATHTGIGPGLVAPTASIPGQNVPNIANNTATTFQGSNPPTFPANPQPNPGQPHDFRDFSHFLANIVQAPNQSFPMPDMRHFLEGALKATDHQLKAPSQDDCLTRRMELWCDPVGVWAGTPGVARWCLLNCRSTENCDPKRCACGCIDEMLFKQKFDQVRLQSP